MNADPVSTVADSLADSGGPAPTDREGLHFLCRTGDIPASGLRAVQAPGYEPLLVCRVADAYHLIADTCTHGQASLSEGEVMDGQVCCPFHGGTFDPATGEATGPPCTVSLGTYVLVRRGDELFVARRSSNSGV